MAGTLIKFGVATLLSYRNIYFPFTYLEYHNKTKRFQRVFDPRGLLKW